MFYPSRPQALSPEAIRARVVQRLQRELPGHALEVLQDEPYRLRLCHPEAGELVLNIGNLVDEVRQSTPGIAEEIITAFVSMAKQALNPPEIELSTVYPALRHYAFLGVTVAVVGKTAVDSIPTLAAPIRLIGEHRRQAQVALTEHEVSTRGDAECL